MRLSISLLLVLVLCLEMVDCQRRTSPRRPGGPTRRTGGTTRRTGGTGRTGATTHPATGVTEAVTGETHTGSDTTHAGSDTTHTGTGTTATVTGTGTTATVTGTGTTQSTTSAVTNPGQIDDKCSDPSFEYPPFMACVEVGCTAREQCRRPDLSGSYCCPRKINGVVQNCCLSAGGFMPFFGQNQGK